MADMRFMFRLLFRLGLIAGIVSVLVFGIRLTVKKLDTGSVILKTVTSDALTNSSTLVFSAPTSSTVTASTQTVTSTIRTNALVLHAVDGDTLDVRIDGQEKDTRVRLLGINTPETVDPRRPVQCFGKAASDYMKALLNGKRVLLKEDVLADEHDKYNRLLRNVFLEDGTDVNALMVREGYASAYLSFPLDPARKRELKDLEKDAKLNENGLWSPNTCNGRS